MSIRLRNLQKRFSVSPRQIRSWASSALIALDLGKAEIGILLVSDRKIRDLNRSYRKKDRPTNVLAFPIETVPPKGDQLYLLGDVVISIETAAREAKGAGVMLPERLKVLLIHGILHLSGLDHERSARQAKKMASEERRLLKGIDGPKNGLI